MSTSETSPERRDPVRRDAARTATLVAAPIALLIAVISIWGAGGFSVFAKPAPAPSPTPQATSLVSLPAPTLPDAVVGVCRLVVAGLPDSVLGGKRRPVSGPEQNAAYGDPPVTLACGVAAPAVAPTDDVTQISGVCWIAKPAGSAATVWATVDRSVPVAVTVPGPSGGSAQPVVSFVDSIKSNDPTAAHYPTGCTA